MKQVVEIKDKLLLTLKEAAELSNIDAMVLREACSRGELSYTVHRGNQKIMVLRKSLEDFAEDLCFRGIPIDTAAARRSHKERLGAGV